MESSGTRVTRWRRRGAIAASGVLAATLFVPVAGEAATVTSAGLRLSVLSNRADLISGGDALVRVTLPEGVAPETVRVSAAGRDVTGSFAMRPNGHFEGLITGLPLGGSVLKANGGRASDTLTVTNHPNGGPVFSGPQVQPWVCQPTARDEQCNQPAEYTFQYKSTNPSQPGLQPYDPADPPSDVATTTTDEGHEVPFVVRLETGYQDRDQYKILTLFDPDEEWRPWSPQQQWNHKVLIPHGGNCGYTHASGEAPLQDYSGTFPPNPAVQDSYITALGRGFVVLSTALDNLGHNCNLVTQAESLMMAKERLVEQYGRIRYTIGTGCSGGSIVQNTVANAYPGIYQGLITTCSYPDVVSTLAQFADLHLLRSYFEDPSQWGPGVLWSPTQMAAVEGHIAHLNAVVADEAFFKRLSNPSEPCDGVGDDERYDAESNPGGVRCLLMDYMINVFGPRPPELWGQQEQEIGRGFGGVPVGNAGVQYGLTALAEGLITPAQFADLNDKIGGLDVDGKPIAGRYPGDEDALRRAYRSGALNATINMSTVAIINHGGPDPGAAHDYGHAYWTRARLEREQGHTDNLVMWFGNTPLIGDPRWANEALVAMDGWLTAVEADTSDTPLADKIVTDKPAGLVDRCSNLPGLEEVDVPGAGKVCEQPVVQTKFGTPRAVAGGPATNDVNACALKPLRRSDTYPAQPSDADWERLQEAFPDGVCDYSEAGVGQGETLPWLSYQDCRGEVRYGGQPLGSAPARSGSGWTSAAFS
ncbi:MAG: hypothetical protein GEU86_14000, partial [Actinophytocola sp.]|nr:hypothetical protein [Actinophytocola sp.]